MAKGKKEDQSNSAVADLMQATLITELGRAGVGQAAIRAIVGCGMNRVNQIVKPIERGTTAAQQSADRNHSPAGEEAGHHYPVFEAFCELILAEALWTKRSCLRN
jgi:hypothetical protein